MAFVIPFSQRRQQTPQFASVQGVSDDSFGGGVARARGGVNANNFGAGLAGGLVDIAKSFKSISETLYRRDLEKKNLLLNTKAVEAATRSRELLHGDPEKGIKGYLQEFNENALGQELATLATFRQNIDDMLSGIDDKAVAERFKIIAEKEYNAFATAVARHVTTQRDSASRGAEAARIQSAINMVYTDPLKIAEALATADGVTRTSLKLQGILDPAVIAVNVQKHQTQIVTAAVSSLIGQGRLKEAASTLRSYGEYMTGADRTRARIAYMTNAVNDEANKVFTAGYNQNLRGGDLSNFIKKQIDGGHIYDSVVARLRPAPPGGQEQETFGRSVEATKKDGGIKAMLDDDVKLVKDQLNFDIDQEADPEVQSQLKQISGITDSDRFNREVLEAANDFVQKDIKAKKAFYNDNLDKAMQAASKFIDSGEGSLADFQQKHSNLWTRISTDPNSIALIKRLANDVASGKYYADVSDSDLLYEIETLSLEDIARRNLVLDRPSLTEADFKHLVARQRMARTKINTSTAAGKDVTAAFNLVDSALSRYLPNWNTPKSDTERAHQTRIYTQTLTSVQEFLDVHGRAPNEAEIVDIVAADVITLQVDRGFFNAFFNEVTFGVVGSDGEIKSIDRDDMTPAERDSAYVPINQISKRVKEAIQYDAGGNLSDEEIEKAFAAYALGDRPRYLSITRRR